MPACASCNSSKKNRLLTEWRKEEKVTHGVKASEKVAAEYDRLLHAKAIAAGAKPVDLREMGAIISARRAALRARRDGELQP